MDGRGLGVAGCPGSKQNNKRLVACAQFASRFARGMPSGYSSRMAPGKIGKKGFTSHPGGAAEKKVPFG